jgi:hypothetical protein
MKKYMFPRTFFMFRFKDLHLAINRSTSNSRLPVVQLLPVFIFFFFLNNQVYAVTKTSTGSGNWSSSSTWSPSGVPANGDDVIIATGNTVTINVTTNNVASITITGTLTIGNNGTNRTVTVTGNVTVNAGGVFNTAGNNGNSILIGGSLINNGTFDMNPGGASASVTFNGSSNQTVSGTGGTNNFQNITINNSGAANNNITEILSSKFTAVAGFLTLSNGIIKLSGSYSLTNTIFSGANTTISAGEGIWLNNSNVTVTGQNGNITLAGLLRITAGTFNIGTSYDNSLIYNNNAVFTMDGGSLNLAGLFRGSATTNVIAYTQSAGTLTACTVGNSSGTYGSFDIRASTSAFTMSGGNIVLQNAADTYYDYYNSSTNTAVTGGTIQFGNASTSSGSVYWMSSAGSVYNLTLSSTNGPTVRLRSGITATNDITIGGTLDAASYGMDINVGHNWINNGALSQGTRTVTFNGTTNQQIGGTAATTFYNLTINKSAGGVTLNNTATIQGAGTFTSGIVTSSSTNLMIFNDNATTTGANNITPSFVDGPVRKIGNDIFTFPVGKSNVGYMLCAISAPSNTTDAFTAEYKRNSAAALGPITAAGLYRVSACEYWQIDRTTGTSNVNVTLSWNGLSPCSASTYVSSLASLVVAHFNGTSWNAYGSNSFTGNGAAGTVTWNSVSSFSPFTIGSTSAISNPLPIRFTGIKAFNVTTGNKIEWTNLTEENLSAYEVERSADGTSFTSIITVSPKTNNGQENNYEVTDAHILSGTNYYRIKAVQTDGSILYSTIVKVIPGGSESYSISVYPNPITTSSFTVELSNYKSGDYLFKLMDMNGRPVMLKTIHCPGGSVSVSLNRPATLLPGLYILQVSGEALSETKKLSIL